MLTRERHGPLVERTLLAGDLDLQVREVASLRGPIADGEQLRPEVLLRGRVLVGFANVVDDFPSPWLYTKSGKRLLTVATNSRSLTRCTTGSFS
jgi:hypothetical protein